MVDENNITTLAKRLRPFIKMAAQEMVPVTPYEHHNLSGLASDDHTQYVHNTTARTITAVHTFDPTSATAPFIIAADGQGQTVVGLKADQLNKGITAGAGLTGGGNLTGDVSLAVGAGTLITIDPDTVGITPGAADYGYIGSTTTPWTAGWRSLSTLAGSGLAHAAGVLNITAGTMISVTAQTADAVNLANGVSQWQIPLTGDTPYTPAWASTASDPGATIAVLRTDASGYLTLVRLKTDTISDKSGANLTLAPTGDITFDPAGNDVLPLTNYDINLGMMNKKYLTLHAAELWVETLVAQDTIATIGGRILVSPTTMLIKNMVSSINTISNNSFETAGGGGVDVFANWDEYAGTGTIVRQTGGYSETYCAQLTAGTGGGYTTVESDAISVVDSAGYQLRFYQKVSNVTYPGRYRIWDATNGVAIVDWTVTPTPSLTWAEQLIAFAIPLNCTSIKIGFACPATNTYVASFDLVTLEWGVIYVKHNQMVSGDIAYMEANGKVEFIGITSAAIATTGGYYYSCTRNLDGTGANDWFAGDALLNTGQIGDGYLDLYSLRSLRSATHIGPTIQGVYRWGTNFNDLAETWAIGNLNGLYGYGASDTYGAAFGLYHPTAASSFLTVDSVEGIRMWSRTGGANTNLAQWFANGTLRVGEYADSKSRIEISSGQINFVTRSASVDYTKMSLSTAGTITLGEVASGEYMTITADQISFYAAGVEQMFFSSYPSIRIGEVANSHSRIELYDGHMDFVYRNSSATDLINIQITAAGAITVGAATTPQVVINSTGMDFKNAAGTPVFTVDTSNSKILLGTPRVAAINSTGFRVGGLSTFAGKFIVTASLDSTDAGNLQVYAAYGAGSGERYGYVGMPSVAGDGSVFNALTLSAGAITGSTGVKAELVLYSGYALANAYLGFVLGTTTMFKVNPAALTVWGGTYNYGFAMGLGSPVSGRIFYGADNSGCQLQIGKQVSTTFTEQMTFVDNVGVTIHQRLDCSDILVVQGAVHMGSTMIRYPAGSGISCYAFVPLTTPLTSTSWDGDLRSTTSKTLIDLSAVFGTPANIKAVLFRVEISDSAAGDYWFIMAPDNTNYRGLVVGVQGLSAGAHARGCLTVPCDGNGDVYFQNLASGASTMEVFLEIWGYYI